MKLIILAALVASCAALPQYFPQQNYQRYQQQRYQQYPQQYSQQYPQQYGVTPTPFPYRAAANYYPDVRARSSVDKNAVILRSTSDVNEGGYHYAFDTDNGIQAEETGVENNGIQAQGQYSYTGDDGQLYSVRYTAGANGFQAEGAHIPTAPPIPEAIARALQQNAADEARGIFDDGSYNDGKYNPGSVFAARSQFNQYQPTVRPQYLNPAFRTYY